MTQSATILPPVDKENRPVTRPDSLAMTFEELLGKDNAPDETADDIIQAVRQGRDTPSGRRPAHGLRH